MEKINWKLMEAKSYLDKGKDKKRFVLHVNLIRPIFKMNGGYYYDVEQPKKTGNFGEIRCYDYPEGWYPTDSSGTPIRTHDSSCILMVSDGIIFANNKKIDFKNIVLSKWATFNEDAVYDEDFEQERNDRLLVIKGFIYKGSSCTEVTNEILNKWVFYSENVSY